MMSDEGFDELTAYIMAQGYDLAMACRFAALVGDTPCSDEHGNLVVLDQQSQELARFPMPPQFIVD